MKIVLESMKFHTSGASGQKNGQFNRKRNSKNIECRIMNIECRKKEFYRFYKLKRQSVAILSLEIKKIGPCATNLHRLLSCKKATAAVKVPIPLEQFCPYTSMTPGGP
jgi:hypothetical protein